MLNWFRYKPLPERLPWHKEPLSLFCLYVFIIVLFRWNFHPPSAGKAVIALAVAAAIMSLPAELGGIGKAVWIGLLFALALVENNSIDIERRKSIAETEQMLSTVKEIGKLAHENLENVTGGNSPAYVAPQPPTRDGRVPLAIVNAGEYPLTGVTMVIMDMSKFPFKIYPTLFVGTLASHVVRQVDVLLVPIPSSTPPVGVATFLINIYAQNGTSAEQLQFRRGKKMLWDYRATVSREAPSAHSMIPIKTMATSDIPGFKLNYEWIEDNKQD